MDALDEPDESITRPPWGQLGRAFTLGFISATSKLFLNVLNSTELRNLETLHRAVNERPDGVGLITVSNHTSTTDDPAVLSAMMPWSHFVMEPSHHRVRWAMCAREICFKNDALRQFFINGKVLPIERGRGISQAIMGVAAELVRRGDWLHIFPEGRVEHSGHLGAVRHGVGKLICDVVKDGGSEPVVLPFFHSGMGHVQPRGAAIPRVGQRVTVTVGQPLQLQHLTCRCNQLSEDQPAVWRDIAAEIRISLAALEAVSPPNPDQSRPGDAKGRAHGASGTRDLKPALS